MIRKLKFLVKNGQISMKKSLKNGRFCQIFDEKKTLRDYSICGAGFSKMCVRDFFLKNGASGIYETGSRPRAALVFYSHFSSIIYRFINAKILKMLSILETIPKIYKSQKYRLFAYFCYGKIRLSSHAVLRATHGGAKSKKVDELKF